MHKDFAPIFTLSVIVPSSILLNSTPSSTVKHDTLESFNSHVFKTGGAEIKLFRGESQIGQEVMGTGISDSLSRKERDGFFALIE